MTDLNVLTVRQAAQLKGVSTQAIRDAINRGEIRKLVDPVTTGSIFVVERTSVEAWQPAIRAGWRKPAGDVSAPQRSSLVGFVPIAKDSLPKSLPNGRWFQLQPGVWIGLVKPDEMPTGALPKGTRELFRSEELVLLRHAPRERKRP